MSNSSQMTLEEKIVQTLKDDSLMKLVGDEDAITELVKRAISESLFQPQRVPRSYGGYDEKDSLTVEVARDVAKTAAEKLIAEISEELKSDEAFKASLRDCMVAQLPQILLNQFTTNFRWAMEEIANDAVNKLRADLQERF